MANHKIGLYPLSFMFGLNSFKHGAWFEPSDQDRIQWALQLLQLQPNDHAVDIGSGDGRVVVAIAQTGATVTGIEQDPKLVAKSEQAITKAKLQSRATIIRGDFWQQDYSRYNKIYLYQVVTVMARLEKKLLAELKPGAKVVSNYWQFPHWPVSNQLDDIRLYIKT